MKSDPFAALQPEPKITKSPKPKNSPNKPSKPKEKEISMDEKLAMLVNKFKK
jgi:hypothetical protein